jgi:hypothetical protein
MSSYKYNNISDSESDVEEKVIDYATATENVRFAWQTAIKNARKNLKGQKKTPRMLFLTFSGSMTTIIDGQFNCLIRMFMPSEKPIVIDDFIVELIAELMNDMFRQMRIAKEDERETFDRMFSYEEGSWLYDSETMSKLEQMILERKDHLN